MVEFEGGYAVASGTQSVHHDLCLRTTRRAGDAGSVFGLPGCVDLGFVDDVLSDFLCGDAHFLGELGALLTQRFESPIELLIVGDDDDVAARASCAGLHFQTERLDA